MNTFYPIHRLWCDEITTNNTFRVKNGGNERALWHLKKGLAFVAAHTLTHLSINLPKMVNQYGNRLSCRPDFLLKLDKLASSCQPWSLLSLRLFAAFIRHVCNKRNHVNNVGLLAEGGERRRRRGWGRMKDRVIQKVWTTETSQPWNNLPLIKDGGGAEGKKRKGTAAVLLSVWTPQERHCHLILSADLENMNIASDRGFWWDISKPAAWVDNQKSSQTCSSFKKLLYLVNGTCFFFPTSCLWKKLLILERCLGFSRSHKYSRVFAPLVAFWLTFTQWPTISVWSDNQTLIGSFRSCPARFYDGRCRLC